MRQRRVRVSLTAGAVAASVLVGVTDGGAGPPAHQADARIKKNNKPFKGNGIINQDGAGQTVRMTKAPGDHQTFFLRVKNRGEDPDKFLVFDNVVKPDPSIRLIYRYKGNNVTEKVDNATFKFGGKNIAPLKSTPKLKLKIVVRDEPAVGSLNMSVNAQALGGTAASRDSPHVLVFIDD